MAAIKNENIETITACYILTQGNGIDQDILDIRENVKEKINDLHIFDDIHECESVIQTGIEKKILLIVNNSCGPELLSRVHDIPQLSICYIFCQNQAYAEEWTKPYPKVQGIFIESRKLIKVIMNKSKSDKDEDACRISVIHENMKIQEARDANFLWFQLFIEILLRMYHKTTERTEMIEMCKREYHDDKKQLGYIQEFENDYVPEKAIWWYTRDTCFYRLINRALRKYEYDTLFIFRFFITDIALDLKKQYEQDMRECELREIFHVYRGQHVAVEEFNLIKTSIGQLLSMNSFLSTSLDRSVALKFSKREKGENRTSILFEIEIDPRMRAKCYAGIQKKSFYERENEVLIMVGALFHIKNIARDEDDTVWIIQVKLASEDDYRLRELFQYMKEKIGEHTSLDTLGKLLLRMDHNERANNCYRRLLQETRATLADSHLGLGWSCMRLGHYDESLAHFHDSLKIRQEIYGSEHIKVAESYSFIGEVFRMKAQFEDAQLNLEIAMKIQEATLEINCLDLAATYNSVGNLYSINGHYNKSFEYLTKALNIRKMKLPSLHPQIAFTYRDIGILFFKQNEFDKAKECYSSAYKISRTALIPQHSLNVFLEEYLSNNDSSDKNSESNTSVELDEY